MRQFFLFSSLFVLQSFAETISFEGSKIAKNIIYNPNFLKSTHLKNNPHESKQSHGHSPEILTGFLFITEPKSFIRALEEDARLPKTLLENKDFIETSKRVNPQIVNFEKLEKGERIYLEVPHGTNFKKISRFTASPSPNITELEYKPKWRERKKTWSLSGFYTASQGILSENIDGSQVKSNQDSPITLGAATVFGLKPKMFFSGSFYLSKLDAGRINNEEKFELPLEYGLTSHANFQRDNWPVTPYGGFDLESFSTLNVSEIEAGAGPKALAHKILYITAGAGKNFQMFGQTLFFKGSVSRSVAVDSTNNFRGTKYILYFASKIRKRWSAHALLKQHFLQGSSELTVTRVGAGIGYTFF